MRRRVELAVPGLPGCENPVVAGLHADGRASLYYGPTAADHLDPAGRLMRAFRTGRPESKDPAAGRDGLGEARLYRSQGDTLAALTRVRTADRTELRRQDLDPWQLWRFLEKARRRLAELAKALADGTDPRRVAGADPRGDLAALLAAALPADGPLAPRYKGKR